uniref:Uncharacterized protein n=1 Tax=Romanomermis culicivorax TaxID=13658 RepID=A0A915J8Y1_ROMCU
MLAEQAARRPCPGKINDVQIKYHKIVRFTNHRQLFDEIQILKLSKM